MRKEFPLTEDEEEAFEALGGFEAYMEVVDRILREHGILRSLYSKAEREQIRRGRRPKGIIEFRYDAEKSIMAHFADLLRASRGRAAGRWRHNFCWSNDAAPCRSKTRLDARRRQD